MSNDSPSAPAASRLDQFVALSSVLTGFTQDTLAPPFDPTDPPLKQLYLSTCDKSNTDTVNQLLAAFANLSGQPAQTIANTLLETGSANPSPTALMARSISKLWYLGCWYQPASTNPTEYVVVAMNAYVGGLAWKAMQAHPMGYSELKFGYWNSRPPVLTGTLDPKKANHG